MNHDEKPKEEVPPQKRKMGPENGDPTICKGCGCDMIKGEGRYGTCCSAQCWRDAYL